MKTKRILTIQDISCVGQCSLTVALPIISACGVEAAILPSAVLSTHTAGFKDFTFRDLTDDLSAIEAHWIKEGIKFDAVYTGYLGSAKQIDIVKSIAKTCLKDNAPLIVDPAMGDGGKLYPGFDLEHARGMASLCGVADIIIPNITEACFMTGTEYKETYDEAYVLDIAKKLTSLGAKTVVLTGIGYKEGETGVAIYENNTLTHIPHKKLERSYHGTGDVFSSAFVGAYMRGKTLCEASKIAAEYVMHSIELTIDDSEHGYGVHFETAIPQLVNNLT